MKRITTLLVAGSLAVGLMAAPALADPPPSCWGQASAVFAQSGLMGMHSSSFDNPRLGIRNLARALADAGLIPDDSMAGLALVPFGKVVVRAADVGTPK